MCRGIWVMPSVGSARVLSIRGIGSQSNRKVSSAVGWRRSTEDYAMTESGHEMSCGQRYPTKCGDKPQCDHEHEDEGDGADAYVQPLMRARLARLVGGELAIPPVGPYSYSDGNPASR